MVLPNYMFGCALNLLQVVKKESTSAQQKVHNNFVVVQGVVHYLLIVFPRLYCNLDFNVMIEYCF